MFTGKTALLRSALFVSLLIALANFAAAQEAARIPVRIVNGPFRGLVGALDEIVEERSQVVVEVSIGDRRTRLWLDFEHIEAVESVD